MTLGNQPEWQQGLSALMDEPVYYIQPDRLKECILLLADGLPGPTVQGIIKVDGLSDHFDAALCELVANDIIAGHTKVDGLTFAQAVERGESEDRWGV